MNLVESFRVAWSAMLTHKVRSLLTMLGIIIGVGAVIGMQAIGNGFSNYLQGQFAALGDSVIYVTPRIDSDEAGETLAPQLTAADAEALLVPGAAPAVRDVAVEFSGSAVVSAGRDRYIYDVRAVSPNTFVISANTLGAGRLFTEQEDRAMARVAVIGRKVAATIFGSPAAAVGQQIDLDGVRFEVVGVLANQPSMAAAQMGAFSDPAEEIVIPYATGRARLFRNQMTSDVDVSRVIVQAASRDAAAEAERQVTLLLRERHRLTYQPNDFAIQSVDEMARQSERAIAGFSTFLMVIGGISLLVGGIGIMNIMLVSVAQRTREIGLRKAVGARRRDIMWQFLIEALVLSLVGGAIGVGLGYLLSFAGSFAMEAVFLIPDARAIVTPISVFVATAVAAAIGIAFGLFPALRAARLDPIRALRTE